MSKARKSNKLIAGVGINDADYPVVRFGNDISGKRNREWICPYYKTWAAMLNRCYREANDERYNAYKDTTVAVEWHTFSNFKSWMEKQDWEGKELDKDLLTDNNQYAPSNCIFIPSSINIFIAGTKKESSTGMTGIYRSSGAYRATSTRASGKSMLFKNVFCAIDFYIESRILEIRRRKIDENLKQLTVSYFNRRKKCMLNFVNENPNRFPERFQEIHEHNMPSSGDRFVTSKGYWYTVVDVFNHSKIKIIFDDGETKFIWNSQIETGYIKKKITYIQNMEKIRTRIDKLFKWNSHGLISGIQYYRPSLIGVAHTSTDKRGCKYFKNMDEAVEFRKSQLINRVQKIVGKNLESMNEALSYFENRWVNEVEKYSGSSQ